jgi:hypothetical protein
VRNPEVEEMNENPKWKVARLDEFERLGMLDVGPADPLDRIEHGEERRRVERVALGHHRDSDVPRSDQTVDANRPLGRFARTPIGP